MQTKTWVLAVAATTALTSHFASTSSAAPPACKRWRNYASDCAILKKPQGCSVSGLEREQINHERFSTNASQACKKALKYLWPSVGNNFDVWPIDDGNPNNGAVVDGSYTSAQCLWDWDQSGVIDWADKSGIGPQAVMVDEVPITPEDHCYCTPTKGKYGNVAWSMQMGPFEAYAATFWHAFPSQLKKAILQANYAANGNQYKSDSLWDPNKSLQKTNLYDDNAAEIDHIIPRVDSQGCLCGDVTPDNAAVISREMNAGMSNTSPKWDLWRSKMYEQFVTCPDPNTGKYVGPIPTLPPGSIKFTDLVDLDETAFGVQVDREVLPARREVTISDDAGCSTTSTSSGSLCIGIAFGLLVWRRKQSRS